MNVRPALSRLLPPLADAARVLVPLAAIVAVLYSLAWLDWGLGWARALELTGAALLLAAAWRWPAPPPRRATPWLVFAVGLAVASTTPALQDIAHAQRSPLDIGWTTDAARHVVDDGKPLYATAIDPQREVRNGTGLHFFTGYKYGPLMLAWYSPFLRQFGHPGGLYVGNAVLLALVAALAAALAARAAGVGAALAALFVVLYPEFVRSELFWQGVNDLFPCCLALAALLAAAYGQGLLAGAALGLSLSAKLLPGALLLLLLPGTVRFLPLCAGLALGLLPYLPHLLSTPQELFANLVLFNALRPPDSTSMAYFLPPWAGPLVQGAALLATAAVAVAYHRSRRSPADLAMAAALVVAAFFAGGKLIHRNYLVAWLPMVAVASGAAFFRSGVAAPQDGQAPARDGVPRAEDARARH